MPETKKENKMKTYKYATDADQGEINARSIQEAYAKIRAEITDAMIEDGATLWVEPKDDESDESDESRLTLGINAD